MWIGPKGSRPSEQLTALLSGKVAWEDAAPSIRSWATLQIHMAAKQIVAQPERGLRKNMLGRIPASIRPHVETEVKRLWALRE